MASKDNNGRTFDISVAAFEFARSGSEHKGMTGLFFCDKHGPSGELVWDGADWHLASCSLLSQLPNPGRSTRKIAIE